MVIGAKPPVPREFGFLVAAVRRFLHPEDPPPNPAGLDWTELTRLAATHGVGPALRQGLDGVVVPHDICARLHDAFERNSRWSLKLAAELIRLASAFEKGGVPFVPLKGPLLSQRLHGNLALRSSTDLDLMVHPRDVLRARDILIARGYRIHTALHWPCDSACLRSREYEISLVGDSDSLSIDLHWRPLPRYFASPFDQIDVWKSLVVTRFAGRAMPDLTNEHLVSLLCSHGAKHAFRRLGWICDIAASLNALPDLAWSELLSVAARCGATRQLLVGLRLAADLLGARLPLGLPDDPSVEALTRSVKKRLADNASTARPASADIAFCLRIMEKERHRLRYLFGNLLIPSRAEYETLQLPPSLYFLYYPFRPLRLAAKHLLR